MRCGEHRIPLTWFAGRFQCVRCAARRRAEGMPDQIGPLVERIVADAQKEPAA